MGSMTDRAMSYNFELVVRTANGQVETRELSAADAAAACSQALCDGLQVLTCVQRRRAGNASVQGVSAVRMGFDIANFSYELSSLMSAGLSVIEALQTLARKEKTAPVRAALLDIVKGINEGLPLSAAMQRHEGRYPPLLIATVSASEQTGDLGTSLRRYAEHQLTVRALRDKVVGSAIYPVLLLAVGCVVVLFLLTVVVPKFSGLIESTRRELPWSSRMLMGWGRFAAQYTWEIALGALVLVALLTRTVSQVIRHGAKAAWVESIPLVGPTMRRFRHAQLYRTTGMLVRGGIAAPRALLLSARLLGDADQVRLSQAVKFIHEGQSMSRALEGAQLADPVATSMLAVAERTGSLADILERIAQFHESSLQRSVELTSRLFEPLLMIFIGLVVGGIVLLMYLPIFDLAASIQ
jgi:general secretion pathway protein F